jgi:preprotein translocase subunit SecB
MTPLVVESYFFPHVNVTADPQYKPTGQAEKAPHFDIKVSAEDSPQNGIWQVVVEIYSAAENEDEHQAYTVNLVCIGLFKVVPDYPEPEKLLRISGAAMLYSAAREFLITVTSRGPWGAITLPMASFIPMQREGENVAGSKKPVAGKSTSTSKNIKPKKK